MLLASRPVFSCEWTSDSSVSVVEVLGVAAGLRRVFSVWKVSFHLPCALNAYMYTNMATMLTFCLCTNHVILLLKIFDSFFACIKT